MQGRGGRLTGAALRGGLRPGTALAPSSKPASGSAAVSKPDAQCHEAALDREVEVALGLPAGAGRASALRAVLEAHGVGALAAWRDASRHQNGLVHRAALLGDAGALSLLAGARADLDAQRPSDFSTPLHLAVRHGQLAATEALKALGADAGLQDKSHETARDLEAQFAQRYVCWHQQADLLMNAAAMVLRRLFQERWAAYAGPLADIGSTILDGSADRVTLSGQASVSRGMDRIDLEEDITGKLHRGQRIWLRGIEVEVAEVPTWTPASSRLRGRGHMAIVGAWRGADVERGELEAQRIPPEPRRPPGKDALQKIQGGRLETWDVTLLAHFCGEEQCQLARALVPEPGHRALVREIKDVRNQAGLHLGRAEIAPEVARATADLLQRACGTLAPPLLGELRRTVEETLGKTVIREEALARMERRIADEHERAEFLDGQLRSVSRFRAALPPGAFSSAPPPAGGSPPVDGPPGDSSTGDCSSLWSGTRASSATRATSSPAVVCGDVDGVLSALTLPDGCDAQVARRCIELAAACPEESALILVIRTGATQIDEVMLDSVGDPDVQRWWKDQQMTVHRIEPVPRVWKDWCRPGGVLVSGQQGRVLRVGAQFHPPAGPWRANNLLLKRALDIAHAVTAVVLVSDSGTVAATTTEEARKGRYVLLGPDDLTDSLPETATDVGGDSEIGAACSTAKKLDGMFFPFMRAREQFTQSVLPTVADEVSRWADGSTPVSADPEVVSDTTAKWLWHVYRSCSGPEGAGVAGAAVSSCRAIAARLDEAGLGSYTPRLLLPIGEILGVLGDVRGQLEVFDHVRRLTSRYNDFENGYSVHGSLFKLYMTLEKHGEARAVLAGTQQLLNRERASREGLEGLGDFMRAKELFHRGNEARLNAKLAIMSNDSNELKKVQESLEAVIAGITDTSCSSFRGNTTLNVADLLRLLSVVAEFRKDTPAVRRANERELQLRRERKREDEVVSALTRLANTCASLGDVDAAEGHLAEAELLLQSIEGCASSGDGGNVRPGTSGPHGMDKILQLRARCAERRNDPVAALGLLQRAASLQGEGAGPGPDLRPEIARLERRRLRSLAPAEDTRDMDELVALVAGAGPPSAPAASKKGGPKARGKKKGR